MTDDIRIIKILWATHYFIHTSRKASKIAAAINENITTIYEWCQMPEWQTALDFWEYEGAAKVVNFARYIKRNPDRQRSPHSDADLQDAGDFSRCLEVWKKMIEKDAHINPESTALDRIIGNQELQ